MPENTLNHIFKVQDMARKKAPYTFDQSDPDYPRLQAGQLTLAVPGGAAIRSGKLEVTVKATNADHPAHSYRDTVNLYQRAQVAHFILHASEMLLVTTEVLEQALGWLTDCLEAAHQHKNRQGLPMVKNPDLPHKRRQRAETYLKKPGLMNRLQDDLQHIGVAGEADNLLLLYLAMTSRKLAFPLHIVLHAKTGSGKSALMEAVAQCMPAADYIEITSMSQKSFYHWDTHYLRHKILLIQDWFALDKEIEYIIRELQSKQKVTRAVTVRDKNNQLHSILKEVYGPVSIISATTQSTIYEDNANRSVQLYLNEGSEQDDRILERQLLLASHSIDLEQEADTRERLRDTQVLLQPYPVKNPYAPYLQLPRDVPHIRRVLPTYLNLIATITLYHQYQRKSEAAKSGAPHLLTDTEDIHIANQLMANILLSKSDLLPKASRYFFERVTHWLKKQGATHFTQRELTTGLRMHPSSTKRHIKTLLEYGYISITGGDRYKKGYQYSINNLTDYTLLQDSITETLNHNLKRAQQAHEALPAT